MHYLIQRDKQKESNEKSFTFFYENEYWFNYFKLESSLKDYNFFDKIILDR